MQHLKSPVIGIHANDDPHCATWPAQVQPSSGWRFIAARVTRAAMQESVKQKFVPPAPALPIGLDRRHQEAEWRASEIDE